MVNKVMSDETSATATAEFTRIRLSKQETGIVQAICASGTATLVIEGRADYDAPWMLLNEDPISLTSDVAEGVVVRLFPHMRARISDNNGAVSVWFII